LKQHELVLHPGRFYIDGSWVTPSGDRTLTVTNSSTGETYLTVPEAQEADVERAVAAARRAFDHGPWPKKSHKERAAVMASIADELEKRADRHAAIWTTESGVLHSIAKPRMTTLAADFRSVARLAETFRFQERHPSRSGGEVALLVREPVGVVVAIVPWNAPPAAIVSKIAPALLAGCTVILKASPEAPGSAYILAEACDSAGLPPGVVNILVADREVSELLVRHAAVDKVAFTGSTTAGRRIASICGERMARCTLELGGKSPAVILDDYDIEKAARSIAERTTFLTGQVCLSLTRVIVTRDRHDAMVDALAGILKQVRVGDPFDASSQMGPLASRRQLDRVLGFINRARSEGAQLATGGRRPPHLDRGFFIEPTVFGKVRNDSAVGCEEVFGPVLSVIAADDEEHAITLANDTIYGLNASVFTNDVERAYHVARRLRTGTVGQNGTRAELGLAFGGFKQSGIGREGGTEGLRSYLETKVVVLDGLPRTAGPVAA
jgi:aldehyde dehydrogenase (NAD+)